MRGAAATLAHLELGGDPVAQLGHVADQPHHPPAVAQRVEGVHHAVERRGVEGAEALVDEEGVELGAAGLVADRVGEAEGQRQRDQERLPSRERGRVALLAVPLVADPQAQPAALLAGAALVGLLEQVALVGHRAEPLVGGRDHLAQPLGEDVRREPHPPGVVAALALDERGEPGGDRVVPADGLPDLEGLGELGEQDGEAFGPTRRLLVGGQGVVACGSPAPSRSAAKRSRSGATVSRAALTAGSASTAVAAGTLCLALLELCLQALSRRRRRGGRRSPGAPCGSRPPARPSPPRPRPPPSRRVPSPAAAGPSAPRSAW